MGDKSKIEWTDASWNPTTGCSRVSAGCDHCYAIRQARRMDGNGVGYDGTTRDTPHGLDWTGTVLLHEDRLEKPLRWTRPRRVFVDSMSDLFHPGVRTEFVDYVFAVMALAPQHTFQILTKRPGRMADYTRWEHTPPRVTAAMFEMARRIGRPITPQSHPALYQDGYATVPVQWPLPNVWLGTSVENQEAADLRIPKLKGCLAAIRWLSCEPLLGPVHLTGQWHDWLAGWYEVVELPSDVHVELPAVDWVVAGGESGQGARPMHPDWVRQLRDDCEEAGVPFFFKQWGNWCPRRPGWWNHRITDTVHISAAGGMLDGGSRPGYLPHHVRMYHTPKRDSGRELDGRIHDEYPSIRNAESAEGG